MEFLITSNQLSEEISKMMESSSSRLLAYNSIIDHCREILELYRVKIKKVKFKSVSDEIRFFKEEKQIPLIKLIYYINLRSLELDSATSLKYRKKLLSNKINRINKFFQANREFRVYVNLEHNYLDRFYYTREFQDKMEFIDSHLYWDPEFNTSHDILLAYLKAYHKLLPSLQKQLETLCCPKSSLTKKGDLHWTASKVDLIELIYALQISGAINNGSANIIDIVSLFEEVFDQKLDNSYKKYTEIKARKGRVTKFLDEITWKFEQKLNRDNAL